jgi:PAS domain S-box-containing protein
VSEAPVKILLVDDRGSNLLSLHAILERPEYHLISASNGEEALRLVLKHEFAVILLDVAMPGMDGFEVAATLKQRERFRAIPIIFVTASIQHIEWIFRAYSVGAVDFLSKPLDPHAVRAKVGVFVELFRQRQQIEQQAAQLSELKVRNLAEAIPHIVFTARPDGGIEYFNRRWSSITGLDDAHSLGDEWWSAVHEEDRGCRELWRAMLAECGRLACDCRLRQSDGSYRWYKLRAVAECAADDGGAESVVRWLGTMTDIEEEKHAQEEWEAAIKLRDEFLSVASHELRTPLSALQLQLQSANRVLGDRTASIERIAGKVAAAVRQTERLGGLVDTLLDVSRLATGRLELNRERFELAAAVGEVVERFREEAAQSGITLSLDASARAAGTWDRLRIEQVVTNLISNAIKYAPRSAIEVRVSTDDEFARVVVRDHGIGIAPEDRGRIFDRFERAVSPRHYGGLGLGLYIARQIVEAHGGRISVESAPGDGSTFTVELPLTSTVRAASEALPPH